jgi:hypothetical protein
MGTFLALGAGVMTIAVLTLSDRVPIVIERVVDLIDPRLSGLVVDPLLDAGHLFVWAAMALGSMLLIGDRWWRLAALVGLAVGATGLEVAQAVASTTRNTNVGDAQANLIGITLGAVAGILLTIDVRAAPR